MKKTLKEYLNKKQLEESILDPIRKDLNSVIWNSNGKITKFVKAHLLKKFEVWLKNYTNKTIDKAYLLGSMAGYQYNNTSDIDVYVVVDVTDEKLKEMMKLLPNGHILPGGEEHPVNYFISNTVKKEWKQSNIFDLLDDKWIVDPKKDDKQYVVSNYRLIIEIARFFIMGITSAISEYEADVNAYETYNSYLEDAEENEKDDLDELVRFKLHEILADIDGVRIAHKMIHSFRKEAFENEPFEVSLQIKIENANFSVNNLLYKYIEKLGFLKKMVDIENQKEKWENLL